MSLNNAADRSVIRGKNGCTRCCYRIDGFFWRKKGTRIARTDYIKAAPCISAHCLAGLRIALALTLIAQSVITVILTSSNNNQFHFISMWNLFAISVLFTTMAVVSVWHSKRIKDFRIKVKQNTTQNNLTQL